MKKWAVTLFLLCACLAVRAEPVTRIVARVNNEIITSKDLDDYTKILAYRLGKDWPSFSSPEQEQEFKQDALEKLIEDMLILAQARKEKDNIPDSLIEDKLQDMIANYASRQEFEDSMVERGLNLTLLRKKIKEQYLVRQAVEDYVRTKVTVSPQEVSQYYREHSSEFTLPPQYVLWLAKSAEEDAIRDIARVIDRKGVKEAQSQYPDSLTRIESGHQDLKEEISEVIAEIREGAYLIREMEGLWHLIYLEKRDFLRTIPLDEAKEQIYAFLHDKKIRERFAAWIEDLKESAVIKVY